MTDDETTVSWMAIEKGWRVIAVDGEEIGEVYDVRADRGRDIFDGLAVIHHPRFTLLHGHLDRPRYVAAEQVHDIQPGIVHLTVTTDESTQLPEH